MPYKVVKVKGGYKVRSPRKILGKYKYYSSYPMPKTRAKRQLKILNEALMKKLKSIKRTKAKK
jgi:hypothetical protein